VGRVRDAARRRLFLPHDDLRQRERTIELYADDAAEIIRIFDITGIG